MNETAFHLPTRPYTPIDALNRRAAALGSPRYAMMAAGADYNGHHVTVHWNDYRGYYIAEYYYGERVVLARGSFASCLDAATREYERGALGSSVGICPRQDDDEAIALCRERGLSEGLETGAPAWWTWRHSVAGQSVQDMANPRALRRVFDAELLAAAANETEYEAAVTARHGRAWTY